MHTTYLQGCTKFLTKLDIIGHLHMNQKKTTTHLKQCMYIGLDVLIYEIASLTTQFAHKQTWGSPETSSETSN